MSTNGRDTRGRFAVGNAGGPGRPPRQTEAEYLTIMQGVCTAERWRVIIGKAVEQAEGGDRHAREWLAGYLVGRPRQRLDVHQTANEEVLDLVVSKLSWEQMRAIDEAATLAEAEQSRWLASRRAVDD